MRKQPTFTTRLGAMLACWSALALPGCLSQEARDGATGCLVASHPLTVLAIDTSEAMTPRQKDLVHLLVERVWVQIPSDGELRVYGLDGRAAEALPRLRVCRGPQLSALESTKSRQFHEHTAREAAKADQVANLASEIVAGAGVGSQAKGSRIYEFISTIESRTQGNFTARQVILVSDMRQYSPQYGSNASLPREGLALPGIHLKVVVLGDGASLPKAWGRLIDGAGAASTEVALETLPASLAQ